MHNNLFDNFTAITSKAWKQQMQFELNGANYNDTLVTQTNEGILIKPFYHPDEQQSNTPNINRETSSFNIGQIIYVFDVEKSNLKAINSLKKGTELLIFIIPNQETSIDLLLNNVDKNTPLYFELQFLSKTYVLELLKKCPLANINVDIINNLSKTGNWYSNINSDFNLFFNITKITKNITINLDLYQNAGANITQQLAYGLAHANEYLNFLDTQNETFNKQSILFTFKVAIGSHYCFEIAKLKALRILWQTLALAYQANVNCKIIALPSKRNKTLNEPKTNAVRTTTECMSAIMGGADHVCNTAYNSIHKKNNTTNEDDSRAQLKTLKFDSFTNQVHNPLDGSYYIDNITEQLTNKALMLFKDLERNGGFLQQLKAGTIQRKIKENAKKEDFQFKNKTLILVGANKHCTQVGTTKKSIELYPFIKQNQRKTLIEPIIEKRLAEQIEQSKLNKE